MSGFTFGSAGGNGGTSQPFGTSNTTSTAGSSLFGGNTTTASSPFGQPATATSKPAAPLFGGGNTSGASTFGANTSSSTPQAGSIFGSNLGSGTTPSLFGGSTGNTPTFATKPSSSAGTTGNLFGTPSTTTATSSTPFSFGPKQGGNGNSTPGLLESQAAPPSGGLLSGINKPAGSSLFGTPTASSSAPVGSTTPAPAKPFSFNSTTPAGPPPSNNGEPPKAPMNNLFSGSNQPSGGLFGPASTTGSTSASLFQQKPLVSGFPTSKPQSDNSSNTPASISTPAPVTAGLFGGVSKSNLPSSTPSQTPSLFQGLSGGATGTAPNISTNTSAQTPSAGSNLFSNLGSSAAATASTTATQTSTTAPVLGGLFSSKPAASSSSQPASVPSTAPPAGSTTGPSNSQAQAGQAMGASTTGPAPQLSRLRNKTMDEIITRWASDLLKYQKEFQEQAAKVAEWDRLLVENGDKIQKLFNSTWEAERASTEVERQLSAVESQQADLTSWLDHYEKDVDEIFARQVGQGETLQGPDQERERTYKLAEKLTDRLDEMGKNLTSMIDAINETSSNLSKSNKTDDPLSHIVRVLNSHLAQLQWIDQNAELLQQKVVAAQKLGQSMASNGYGNQESDVTDSLFRSYMGRR